MHVHTGEKLSRSIFTPTDGNHFLKMATLLRPSRGTLTASLFFLSLSYLLTKASTIKKRRGFRLQHTSLLLKFLWFMKCSCCIRSIVKAAYGNITAFLSFQNSPSFNETDVSFLSFTNLKWTVTCMQDAG